MQTVLKVNDLCYKSGRRYLLNHINWEVQKGEHWLIFGMNGSGKTTLLSMIAGFKSATSGQLEVLGQHYDSASIYVLRKKIGWISSSFFDKYYKEESALQVVLSGLTGTFNVDDTITDADVRYAKALLWELRMGEKLHQPFGLMSKGERQNVLIARALITKPEILVLDEPGTGLDVYARVHMMNTVRMLAENAGVTILYVTHYPEEIQCFMNKTLLLKNGRVFAQGDTATVLNSKNLSVLLNESVVVQRTENGSISMAAQAPSRLCQLCYGKRVKENGK